LIHIAVKKPGRFDRIGHRITGDRKGQSSGVGWEFVHVGIDDAARTAFTQIKPDEKAVSATAFLKAAVADYSGLGVKVARVMTGSCYKSFAFARACRKLKIKHIRTKPHTPKTNGEAERFIQTSLREWAYARPRPALLDPPIQWASPARRPNAAHRSPRSDQGQPIEAPQLEHILISGPISSFGK
jgi:hypothetical protein